MSSDEELVEPTSTGLSYGSYLHVPELLSLQKPESNPEEHDETLFIIIHQVYELWFKQILHEVSLAYRSMESRELMPYLRGLQRIISIQKVLTSQVDVLETMTPNDFNRFRGRLNPASGFQSFQFRLLEFRLGCKDEAYLRFHQNNDHNHAQLTEALRAPTLYDAFFHCLASLGHNVPKDVLERDVSKSYEAHTGVEELFLSIYRDPQSHYELYLTLEAMMDLDQNFGLWRSRHVSMVERMIGSKRGTGGSTGVKYLSQTLSKRFFPEIWSLRNHLSDGCY